MKMFSVSMPAALLTLAMVGQAACAQCLQNHYVSDGLPTSQLDCQPIETLASIAPEQMSSAAQTLVANRHAELARAARFYGFELDAAGWQYQQLVSPMLQKHLLLSFTRTSSATETSRFVAVLPSDSGERVQIVPASARGMRLFDPGWQKKGTQSVFNRLLSSEHGLQPIRENSEWIHFASLYIALSGMVPSVPMGTDSVKATWELARKRATTPLIYMMKNGGAVISVSDVSEGERTSGWNLTFDQHGQIRKVERQSYKPAKMQTMAVKKEPGTEALRSPSPLNP